MMMPPNRIEQLNNFTNDLQQDNALSNLRAMQALQQGIPSLMNGMQPPQTPMLNMNQGGLVSLPVVNRLFGGWNPLKSVGKAVSNIGKGIGKGVKSIGKGLSGAFKGLTSGNTGDMLKTMALMAAFSMMGPVGGMNPHLWRAIYGGFTPALARGKLKFDPMSAAMTVGGGYLGDKLTGPAQGAASQSMADIGNMQAGVNPGTMNISNVGNINPTAGTLTAGTTNPAQLFGNPSAIPTTSNLTMAQGADYGGNLFARNVTQPLSKGLDYARDIANTPIPGAETLKDLGQTDVGLKSLNDVYPGEYEIFKSDSLFPNAAPNVGKAVAGAAGGYEASQIYNEQAEAEQKYNDWMADQEAAAEQAQMPTREWLKRIVDDPVKFTYTYKGPLSYEELIQRATQGTGNTETAQMFDPSTYTTESGRDTGMYNLGQSFDANARYGGYLPNIRKAEGGLSSLPVEHRLFGGIGKMFNKFLSNPIFGGGGGSSSPSGGGGKQIGIPLGRPMNNPDMLRKMFKQPANQETMLGGEPLVIKRNVNEEGGLRPLQIQNPSVESQSDPAINNNVLLLEEENKKAVAAQQTEFMFNGTQYASNPSGMPMPITASAYGSLPMKYRNMGNQPQQFFSGQVPNTTNPNSDGMSDDETMVITGPTGKDPRGIMKISEQEYVMSAPDMAILGNGDPNAGAQLLDGFRENLRQAAYGTRAHQPRLDQNKALASLAHKAFG
tara:strand:- start:8195 stop:10354 length:2160 start_codon:yes stop_codon:yes gene_type:complete